MPKSNGRAQKTGSSHPAPKCYYKRYATTGVNEHGTRIGVYRVSCLTHNNFKTFRSQAKQQSWVCPGKQES